MTALLFEVSVPGDPRAKRRPRHGQGRTFTPTVTAQAEHAIGWAARAGFTGSPLLGRLVVEVDFRTATERRCDIDNLAKLVLDALNGVVWADDSQIERLSLTKVVDRAAPRTEIRVYSAERQAA